MNYLRVWAWCVTISSFCFSASACSGASFPLKETLQSQPKHKFVWISLDGLQTDALKPWVSQIKNPHPKGLSWLLYKAKGLPNLKVVNPTITAPSHISTITCSGAGVHGILDNTMWNGTKMESGFARKYRPETWITRLRQEGLRVASSLYPSIDGSDSSRSADVGYFYDSPVGGAQLLPIVSGQELQVTVPHRLKELGNLEFKIKLENNLATVDFSLGTISGLTVNKPQDLFFDLQLKGMQRKAAVSFMLTGSKDKRQILVSPVEVLQGFDSKFLEQMDQNRILFSSLKDYRLQNDVQAYLATMAHRRDHVFSANKKILAREDLDGIFLYFEDLDALLHAFIRDERASSFIVRYLAEFDQKLGSLIESLSPDTNLVVLGDHGMSAIGYVLNARKILGESVAKRGVMTTGGGVLYFYPPEGSLQTPPPADLNIEVLAQTLRDATFEVTGQRIFSKVILRGSKEAEQEGLVGSDLPWIMAFGQGGLGFKNSVEDRFLLARAKWASIPPHLLDRYPDPTLNGELVVPVPAGQHGHWNDLPEMKTRLVLEGPEVSQIKNGEILKTLDLVPHVADALHLPRPASCR